MLPARKVALRANAVRVAKARVRRAQKGLELVITDPRLGEFAADESFTVELLELVHPHETRSRLPNGGWRRGVARDELGQTAASEEYARVISAISILTSRGSFTSW
jgi:hypothetical protein